MAMVYDRDSSFPVDPRLRAKKLHKRKIGAGRPANVKKVFHKTPPRNMVDDENDYMETGDEMTDFPQIDWQDTNNAEEREDTQVHSEREDVDDENESPSSTESEHCTPWQTKPLPAMLPQPTNSATRTSLPKSES